MECQRAVASETNAAMCWSAYGFLTDMVESFLGEEVEALMDLPPP